MVDFNEKLEILKEFLIISGRVFACFLRQFFFLSIMLVIKKQQKRDTLFIICIPGVLISVPETITGHLELYTVL